MGRNAHAVESEREKIKAWAKGDTTSSTGFATETDFQACVSAFNASRELILSAIDTENQPVTYSIFVVAWQAALDWERETLEPKPH